MSRHEIGKYEMSGKWNHLIIGSLLYIVIFYLLYDYVFSDIEFLLYVGKTESNVFLGTLGFMGIFGLYRFINRSLHIVRATYYLYQYKQVKKNVDYNLKPKKLFIKVPFYKKEKTTINSVMNFLLEELYSYSVDTELFISVSPEDRGFEEIKLIEKIISNFHLKHNLSFDLDYVIYPQSDKGKRDAIVKALRKFIDKIKIDAVDNALILMDGDTIIPKGTFSKCIPFLFNSKVGGLTLNNIAYVNSDKISYIQYLINRFKRRLIQLCSFVTVLTGRFSVIKGSLINDEFINILENHVVYHERLGNIKSLTGDDKSTWLMVLKSGLKMMFIPDASIYTMEEEPNPENWIERKFWPFNVKKLEDRYAGNMMRTAIDAMKLGPKKIGWVLFYILWDQLYMFWTPIVSRLGILFLSIYIGIYVSIDYGVKFFILSFLFFSINSIYYSIVVAMFNKHWSPYDLFIPSLSRFLISFFVKTKVFFNLNVQGWKHGKTTGEILLSSQLYQYLFLAIMFTAILCSVGIIGGSFIPRF